MLFIGVSYVKKIIVKVFVCVMSIVLSFVFKNFFIVKWIKVI